MTTSSLAPAPIRPAKTPKVGIVSLGCPKALVDSERIVTRLRAEGYQIAPDYAGADLVLVNTCGFLDSARDESLGAIGEAIEANGKVIVTGCLGAEPDVIEKAHPKVLAITGPHQYEAVMEAVHTHLTPPHNPHMDLVPESGLRLTPRHYAYLKISEGCNNRCSFCIIPKLPMASMSATSRKCGAAPNIRPASWISPGDSAASACGPGCTMSIPTRMLTT